MSDKGAQTAFLGSIGRASSTHGEKSKTACPWPSCLGMPWGIEKVVFADLVSTVYLRVRCEQLTWKVGRGLFAVRYYM